MVLPFLTVYMTASLGYSTVQAGIIMSVFGIGGMLGSYLGGRLSDKLNPFHVQVASLIFGGLAYLLLPMMHGFYALAAGVLICALINDALRPAISSMVGYFATPETTTRSFSLLRMAINLGVAIGPAVAGMLAGVSYVWLFVGDGITCIAAGIVSYFYFRHKQPVKQEKKHTDAPEKSPYTDPAFMYFLLLCFVYAFTFFQIFSSIPLYYKDVYLKSEQAIGLFLAFNGLILFVFEMITVSQIEKRFSPMRLIFTGNVMLGLSFVLFNVWHADLILILSMLLLSFSEMFAMPFMIAHTIHSSTPATRGSYTASYTIAWSVAFIASPYLSTLIIEHFGFSVLWWVMGSLCFIAAYGITKTKGLGKSRAETGN